MTDYIDDMAIALRLAIAWIPNTPHGEIVKKRIGIALATYEIQHPIPKVKTAATFRNRLMQ